MLSIISIIIALATLAGMTALYVVFVGALLNFFDYVVKGIKKAYKAIKIYIKRKNSNKVEGAVLVETEDGIFKYRDTTQIEPIDIDDLSEDAKKTLLSTPYNRNGEQMIGAKITQDAEEEIRRRTR